MFNRIERHPASPATAYHEFVNAPFYLLLCLCLGLSLSAAAQTTTNNIDNPPGNKEATLSGTQVFGGWSVDSASTVAYIVLELDGDVLGQASYGGNRQDVCNVYKNYPGCPNVGWSYAIDTTHLTNGWHWLRERVTTTDGRVSYQDATFYTNNASASLIDIDAPSYGSTYSGTYTFGGWAIDNSQVITGVKVFLDGVWLGNAGTGGYRPDACRSHPNAPGCPNVGWSFNLDTRTIANGTHVFSAVGVTADGRTTRATTYNVTFNNSGAPNLDVDNPQALRWTWANQVLGGWSINSAGALQSASVSIDGIPLGNAGLTGRQDVCNVYKNYPGCPNVGWSFSFDTAQIGDGTHQVAITSNFSNSTHCTVIQPFVTVNSPSADAEYATGTGPGGCNQLSSAISSAAMIRQPGADGYIHVTYAIDDPNMGASIANAADMWNSLSSTTRVQFDAAPAGTTPDLSFTFDSSGKYTQGCTAYIPRQKTIFYGGNWKNSFTPAADIAHELGHFLGLADAGPNPSAPTIMNQADSPVSCSLSGKTTTPQTVDAVTSPICGGLAKHYLKELQTTQAMFDAQRRRYTVSSWLYPPYPPPAYDPGTPWYCTYTYSTVNFYVDGQYDSSEDFVDGITCTR